MNQPPPGQFLQACGATGPLQFEIEHPERREIMRRTLPLPFAVVGRNEQADIPLDDKNVSHRHAYLQVVAGRLWCVDLESRTGVHWEDGSSSPGPLTIGQRIQIGPFHLRLVEGCAETDAGSSSGPSSLDSGSYEVSSLPRVSLEFLEGATERSSWRVDRVVTLVGRSDHCKVRLRSPTVSRMHCALLHTSAGLWVIDLLGREGTSVNGASVRWALLEDADELRIGQFRIRVRQQSKSSHVRPNGLLPSPSPAEPSPSVAPALPVNLGRLFSPSMSLAPLSTALATAEGGSASLLLPLLSQFSLLQQQTFDQFQQALLMVVQMFGSLHRDQLQIIRQELNQLHRLTGSLQGLQKELAQWTAGQPRLEKGPAEKPQQTPFSKPTAPAASSPIQGAATAHAPSSPLSSEPPKAPAAAPPVPPAEGFPQTDAEIHAWLSQRLALFEEERQSTWQKILQTLTGR